MKTYIFIAIAVSSACASHDSEITTTPSMPHENQYASYTQHIPGALFGAAAASLLWLGKARLNKKRSDFHIKLSDELDEQQQKTKTALLEKELAATKNDFDLFKIQAQTDIASMEKLAKNLDSETKAKDLACNEVAQCKKQITSILQANNQTEIETQLAILGKEQQIKELFDTLNSLLDFKNEQVNTRDASISALTQQLAMEKNNLESVKKATDAEAELNKMRLENAKTECEKRESLISSLTEQLKKETKNLETTKKAADAGAELNRIQLENAKIEYEKKVAAEVVKQSGQLSQAYLQLEKKFNAAQKQITALRSTQPVTTSPTKPTHKKK